MILRGAAMRIEHYDFGTITIDGKTYTSDLKIVNRQVVPDWWRRQGHQLDVCDVEDILEAKPSVLVVGTGYSGLMVLSSTLKKELQQRGISLIAKPTGEACKEFNKISDQSVAFAAHLTC